MVGSHIAHDCQVGDDVILVNHVSLGGHVVVEDFAIIGGLSGIHQFCRIGRHAMVGAHSMIVRDVLPYDGDRPSGSSRRAQSGRTQAPRL